MRVGDAVVSALAEAGIDAVFGIPGKQTLPLNQAMAENDIRYVVARHETAVSHQAWGYAETTGRPAATVVIPGPGDMNAMNGLKNALNDCTPLVHIAVETEPGVRGGDGIHETPPDTYDNVVKENFMVETPQSAVAVVTRALEEATTHPKGPVRVGIPKNFLPMAVTQAATDGVQETASNRENPSVSAAVSLLEDADEPAILAGGGIRASGASASLKALAEQLDAPVVTTYKGKGTFPEDHDLSAGVLCGGTSPEVADVLESADVLLAVGTDFDAVSTGKWKYDLPENLIHVTYHADDIGTGYDPAVGIVGDADKTLRALADALSEKESNGAKRATAARAADRARFEALVSESDALTSVEALQTIRTGVPRDAIVTADAGGFRIWTLVSFPIYDARSYVNPGSWATMGTGLPSAIGAKVANPERDVISLNGDGGLLMCIHELHTLAASDIDVTVVVFTNHDYAIISEEAARSYGLADGAYGWSDAPIDFVALAESLGLTGRLAETPEEISAELDRARTTDGATLIEIPTDPYEPQASEWMTKSH